MNINNNQLHLTKKENAAAIQIWNRAAISLLDIRHYLISSEEALKDYILPASTFIYTCGKNDVLLNSTLYSSERFGLFHGPKGTKLSIHPEDNWLEYYLVLYKFSEPNFYKWEFHRLMEVCNPFGQQYGFAPSNPLLFGEQLKKLFEHWKDPTPLNLFYGKAVFYQFVYEIYRELEEGNIQAFEPDMISMAGRYLDQYYGEDISIQELSQMLGISYSHFHRSFKKKMGSSPQEYLIHTRLNAAIKLLETSGASLREIAISCGLLDEQGLYRLFKKKMGVSPSAYRENLYTHMRDSALQNSLSFPYNCEGQVSLDELKGKGEPYMLKQIRGKAIVAAALSLMLLTACSTTVNNKGGDSTPTPTVTSQAIKNDENEPVETGTRTINTTLGEVLVPVNPKRVVVQYLMGDVVALGITPVGVSDVYDGAAFKDLVTDSVSLGWFPEWEAESIMALEPDLILVIGKEDIEKFSKIAPTILVPYGDMTQNERITFMGEVLNRQEEAAAAIELYDTVLEGGKTKLLEAGFDHYTVSVFEGGADAKISVRGDQFGTASILYKELGIRAPKAVQENIIDKESGGEQVSFEVLADYSGDFIIRNTYEGMAELSENAIWNSIPAVVNNRVIGIEFGLSYYPDILSATAQLTFVTEELLEAAK